LGQLIKRTAVIGAGAGCAIVAWKVWKRADLKKKNRSIRANQKVVIIGAGFAGLNVAQELSNLLPAKNDGQITLVDQNNYLLFTPMLTEVAGGELNPHHILASPRLLSPRINFEQGLVHDIDLDNRSVVLDVGDNGTSRRTLKADHVVIALGSVADFHGIPGVQEHSLGLKTIADAVTIRNRILESLERASWELDSTIRKELLTYVVGGGGYTGVETMAAVNDLVRTSVKHYPRVAPGEIRTVIIEPGDRLMSELSADLAAFGQRKLEERCVEIRLRTKITRATGNTVELEHGECISTRILIWAGGITPNPLIDKLDCKRGEHGGIVVDEYCGVPDHAGIWALGDCAEVSKPQSQSTYAPTAQNATREGAQVARNIVAILRGDHPEPFHFRPIGELALVGRHSGVAKIYGHHFSGFLAWAMWRAVYLSKMPGMAQRSRILFDWLLDFIFGRKIAELPLGSSLSGPRQQHHPAASQHGRT
jgi:NADH:ubiquinone reductase (H+-translocating)